MESQLVTYSQSGNTNLVKRLLKAGANVHAQDDLPLCVASENGHLEVVKELLRAGANVHAQDDLSLQWASQNGHLKIVRELLRAGANVHIKDDYALRFASQNGHWEVVKYLLKAGANVHVKDDLPLCVASENGHLEVVKELLKAGANVHAQDDLSLQWASQNGHLEIVKKLLRAGANVHAQDDYALQWASQNGHWEVVKELLKAGADVHAQDDYALRFASQNGHLRIVKYLLKAGANVHVQNNLPLQLAIRNNHMLVAIELQRAGMIDINSVYESLSETKENQEMKAICHNEEDILLQPLDTGKGIVAILTLTHDEKQHVVAECYLPNQLFHTFESQEKLTERKYINEQKTGKTATDKRVYKLPSGAWIDQEGYDNCKKFNTLVLVKVGVKLIGSSFGVSQIHGSEDTIYTLKPIPRSVFVNKQKFKIEDYANFTEPSEQDKNPLFGKMIEGENFKETEEDDFDN